GDIAMDLVLGGHAGSVGEVNLKIERSFFFRL
ncbi:MAG: hypothetical protein RJB68_25, partial [Pseudomonadota bacterium]